MAIKKSIFVYALIITIVMFSLIFFANYGLNMEREKVVANRMEDVLEEYKDLQTIYLLSDIYGADMACLSFKEQLSKMDKSVWEAGQKLDRYRELSEEFSNDPVFIEQKVKFNRNEAMYYAMLKSMKTKCDVDQTIILYFYKKKSECPDCDAQSFVLTDINKKIDPELSIFSFDLNLNISSINMLQSFYGVDSYPCMVVEEKKYCGLLDKDAAIKAICENANVSLCKKE